MIFHDIFAVTAAVVASEIVGVDPPLIDAVIPFVVIVVMVGVNDTTPAPID